MPTQPTTLTKAPTGIEGFDRMSRGGLPAGRVTAVLGGAGAAKTIFSAQALAQGWKDHGDPGLFVAFEEPWTEVLTNLAGFSWCGALCGEGIGHLDAQLPATVLRGGEFDLLGLLALAGAEVDRLGAKRIVLDGLDTLIDCLADEQLIRREIFRLREWLGERSLTAIMTVKSGEAGVAPAYRVLEFLADCVVLLSSESWGPSAVRSLRISKYRGSGHADQATAFVLGPDGLEVIAQTSPELRHEVSSERLTSGVPDLDAVLGGGLYRGTSTLISGAPGTAKTTLSACFARAACARGERVLFVSFDEAPAQIVRNLASVDIDLAPYLGDGTLLIESLRSTSAPASNHVSHIARLLHQHRAEHLIVDPISAFTHDGDWSPNYTVALWLVDLAKERGCTLLATSLLEGAPNSEATAVGLSTIADTWLLLTYLDQGGERNRCLSVIKSRGSRHSNQVRELELSSKGIALAEPFKSHGEVLLGTLRWEKEREEQEILRQERRALEERRRLAELGLKELELRQQLLERERDAQQTELESLREEAEAREREHRAGVHGRHARRGADSAGESR